MLALVSIIKLVLILVWSFIAIVIAAIVYLLTWSSRISIILAKHLWSRIMIFLLGARIKVIGKENIDPNQRYLIIANHSSYADIPTLFRALPLYLRFIGKDELRKVPFLGFYMRMAGMIFIDRSNPRKARQSLLDAAQIAKDGSNVVIFPEGTTIEGDEIANFKRGARILAMESESTILPVRIRNTHRVWPSNSNLRIRGGKIEVTIGKPIPFEDYQNLNTTEFLKDMKGELEKL